LSCYGCTSLTSIPLENCTGLQELSCSGCTSLTSLSLWRIVRDYRRCTVVVALGFLNVIPSTKTT
jgi:hypothetical protein